MARMVGCTETWHSRGIHQYSYQGQAVYQGREPLRGISGSCFRRVEHRRDSTSRLPCPLGLTYEDSNPNPRVWPVGLPRAACLYLHRGSRARPDSEASYQCATRSGLLCHPGAAYRRSRAGTLRVLSVQGCSSCQCSAGIDSGGAVQAAR